MGGLGPGIGGLELLVIGLIALIVVGPKDLPVLLRKVGRAVGKARAMANEFRASFDEMARQSELDELRKEVEALRRGQGLVPLGAEAESTFRDISENLNRPLETPTPAPAPALTGPEEWPDSPPVTEASETPDDRPAAVPADKPPRARKRAVEGTPAKAKPSTRKAAAAKGSDVKTPATAKAGEPASPRTPRRKAGA